MAWFYAIQWKKTQNRQETEYSYHAFDTIADRAAWLRDAIYTKGLRRMTVISKNLSNCQKKEAQKNFLKIKDKCNEFTTKKIVPYCAGKGRLECQTCSAFEPTYLLLAED